MTSAPAPAAGRAPDAGRRIRTRDGAWLRLRAIRSDDGPALQRAFARLTPDQVRQRVFHALTELTPELQHRLTHVDPALAASFVAIDADGEIRAEARLSFDPDGNGAEFGIIVDPSYAGRGVGRRLLREMLAECRRRGVRRLRGDILAENGAMLDLAAHLGFRRLGTPDDPGIVRVERTLRASPRRM